MLQFVNYFDWWLYKLQVFRSIFDGLLAECRVDFVDQRSKHYNSDLITKITFFHST